jgi:hypothetical protein
MEKQISKLKEFIKNNKDIAYSAAIKEYVITKDDEWNDNIYDES